MTNCIKKPFPELQEVKEWGVRRKKNGTIIHKPEIGDGMSPDN